MSSENNVEIKDEYVPQEKQLVAHRAKQRYKLFGGAMGGGKSRWLCEEVKRLAIKYPGNRILMARYHLSDFKNTTLRTLMECMPEIMLEKDGHNKSEQVIRLINGSEILYMGLSEEKDVAKMKSMELGAFAFDEASEIPKEQFLLACSRLRRRLPDAREIEYYGILTSNPEDCWLKDMFIRGEGGDDFIFIPSLPRENAYLPEDYEDNLRKIYPEDWINRYLDGSWDDMSVGNFVIPQSAIDKAVNREIPIEYKECMGIDVSRGIEGDETVIYVGLGGKVIDWDYNAIRKTDETAMKAQRFIKEYNCRRICIDDIGVGAGVTDFLGNFLSVPGVEGVNVGKRSEDDRFFNLKAELWWYARQLFLDGRVSIPNDPRLIRQLGAVKYRIRNTGKLMLETKEETKSRIGQSPDRADALILMLWAQRGMQDSSKDFARVEVQKPDDGYGWDSFHRRTAAEGNAWMLNEGIPYEEREYY